MTRPTLRYPETVREALQRRYRNRHRNWLAGQDIGEDTWPLEFPLGCPSEGEAQLQGEAVREWVQAWRAFGGRGELVWCERRWRTLGTQQLPERLLLHAPEDVAAWIGEERRWRQGRCHYQRLTTRWPALASRLPRHFDALADYSAADILRLETMLAWFEANPRSNLYPRQVPIAGIHSKWLEARMPLIADLMGNDSGCGLKEAPHIVRFRILDDALRQRLGGIGDIAAPLDDISGLQLPVSRVYIVENVQTGLAFGDRPGSVVFMGLGYGITALTRLPWLSRAECIYWGDLDTHGFAILSRARSCLPALASVLMDEATLLEHTDLWVEENDQYPAAELPLLSDIEQQVYRGLKQQRWGVNVRLEQERIAWNYAWERLQC